MSPFFVDHGWHPHTPATLAVPKNSPAAAKEFIQNARARLESAANASKEAQQKLLAVLQKRTRPARLMPGDLVWMSSDHVALAVPYKLTPRWLGPFKVITVTGNNVRLALPATLGRRSPVVAMDRLRLYHPRDPVLGASPMQPPPVCTDAAGATYYTVEKIYAHRHDLAEREFHVRWAGYDASHDTWEPEHRLRADVPQLHDAYLAAPSSLRARASAPLRRSAHVRR